MYRLILYLSSVVHTYLTIIQGEERAMSTGQVPVSRRGLWSKSYHVSATQPANTSSGVSCVVKISDSLNFSH